MLIIVFLILFLSGCLFHPQGLTTYYSAPSPSWREEKGPYQSTLFLNEMENAVIAIRKDCDKVFKKTPPQLLSDRLFIGISSKRQILERENFTFKNTPALRTLQLLRLQKGAIKVENILIMNEECIVDIIFLSKENTFDKLRDDFRKFLDGIEIREIIR